MQVEDSLIDSGLDGDSVWQWQRSVRDAMCSGALVWDPADDLISCRDVCRDNSICVNLSSSSFCCIRMSSGDDG